MIFRFFDIIDNTHKAYILAIKDEVAEWLRRWTANPLCFAREGSNPFLVEFFLLLKIQI